jgi:hypothetical protein
LVGTAQERIPGFPTQLPLDLLLPIVGCASEPGDRVLDPFAGSGTSGHAALQLGRKYIGIEKNEEFAELCRARLAGVVPEQDRRGDRPELDECPSSPVETTPPGSIALTQPGPTVAPTDRGAEVFIRSKVVEGETNYQLIKKFRDKETGKIRHHTIASLGRHRTVEAALKDKRRQLNRLKIERSRWPEQVAPSAYNMTLVGRLARLDANIAGLTAKIALMEEFRKNETTDTTGRERRAKGNTMEG